MTPAGFASLFLLVVLIEVNGAIIMPPAMIDKPEVFDKTFFKNGKYLTSRVLSSVLFFFCFFFYYLLYVKCDYFEMFCQFYNSS